IFQRKARNERRVSQGILIKVPAVLCVPGALCVEAWRRRILGGVPVDFLLNGRNVRVDNPQPHVTLLDFIRAQGLTGAKEGCAEGECGACAVALVEPEEGASAFHVINSCLMFLPMAAGWEIYTVESLAANGQLSEAQRAMAEGGGSQCGYCTP